MAATKTQGTLFRLPRKEDLYPLCMLLVVSTVQLAALFACQSALSAVIVAISVFVPLAMLGGAAHNHAHISIFRDRRLNQILDILFYFGSGVFVSKFRLHHICGHHAYWADPERDPSRWVRKDGSVMGRVEYTARYFLTFTYHAIKLGRAYPPLLRTYGRHQIITIVIWAVLLAVSPVNALILYLLPMRLAWLTFNATTYDHHLHLYSDNPYAAAHTQTHWLPNLLTFNNGYHMAHHAKQAVHWADLPAFHESIKHLVPADLPESTSLNRIWA